MTAVRAEQEREVLAAATAMVDALLDSDDGVLVRKVVAAAFPWVSYLSGEEVADLIDELIASLRVGSSLDNSGSAGPHERDVAPYGGGAFRSGAGPDSVDAVQGRLRGRAGAGAVSPKRGERVAGWDSRGTRASQAEPNDVA